MVMGPTHAMSGAAFWLTASALGTSIAALNTSSLPVILLGTAVCAGAALAPDIDSGRSTVVNSFGALGRIGYHLANGASVSVHSATRTKYDREVSNGHRTLFHTLAMALLVGGLVSLGSSLPGTVEIFGKVFPTGQLFSLIVMGLFLHLALAGLFEKQVKKYRKKFGPYVLMASSAAITIPIAFILPENEKYQWLGIAVGLGWMMHILGDAITKMGSPVLWPLKIKGKRWYDVALPSFLRITAGGRFEKAVLLPVLTVITSVALIWHIPGMPEVTSSVVDWFRNIGD